ncbi:hypothetical protein GF312_14880 [Candidatus Poribacteria bacterium]|nr:hypothetical protein [Candidatus Poribacteria bacterium]
MCVIKYNAILITFLIFMGLGFSELTAQSPGTTEISLYFMDSNVLRLIVEKRSIELIPNTVNQMKMVINELLKGPISAKLLACIPEGTELREIFLDEKGCAYVDFSRTISQKHPGGTTGELVTIASIVNTLSANFPEEVRKIRILIDGKEAKTLVSHIDISGPIFPFELN